MRRILFWATLMICQGFSIPFTQAGEESCAKCGREVKVIGEFAHHKYRDTSPLQGVAPNLEAALGEEIYGKDFSLVIPGLPPGRYTLTIGEVDMFFHETGQRVFDVTAGPEIIATNFDIVASAGGPNKVYYLRKQVDWAGTTPSNTLQISFVGHTENAKFNTFHLQDSSGATLVALNAADLADPFELAAGIPPVVQGSEIWKDDTQPLDNRVWDLVRRLSPAEKVEQLRNNTPAVSRLGLPAYNFWNECLHGVARAGIATVFPQAIGMAATWDVSLIHTEADVIATEARAKHNDYTRQHNGDSAEYYGLTFWTPNINLFRDPRWGRGQETYGEDPFLTGRLGVAFIRGLQGDDPRYLKAMACAKHYAVHSGPESERHSMDVDPPERDFYENYLPHFEAAVREGQVGGVMGAYNSVYGKPACANPLLLETLLRNQWGFDGYVVSDCGAIQDIYAHHHFVDTAEAAAACAVKAGCDICCGGDYNALTRAVQKRLVAEGELDRALFHALKARFRLGLFDPSEHVSYSQIQISGNDTTANRELALKVAHESIVLLKNDGLLPLARSKIKRIAVIGPNTDSNEILLGNYHGTPSHAVTILQGIRAAVGPNLEVLFEPGCSLAHQPGLATDSDAKQRNAAVASAQRADVIIYVGGLSPNLEGEEMKVNYEGFAGGDRTRIELPDEQTELLKALAATGKPLVLVNCSGSAVALPWEAEHFRALVQAWYPGEEGGRAVAEVLFGDVNPAGRLPITFYRATTDLPPFTDYSFSNRTYRYFAGEPLFAFGHGLSYTRFAYRNASLARNSLAAHSLLNLCMDLSNVGGRDGDEVVQVYFRHLDSKVSQPKLALCGFARVHLLKGAKARLSVEVPVERLRYWDVSEKRYVVEPGKYELLVGGASDDIRVRLPVTVTK